MKKALRLIVISDLLFLAILTFSGMLKGWVSDAVYMSAFAVPIIFALALNKRTCENSGSGFFGAGSWLKLGKEELSLLLPIVFPTLLSILAISYLTSLMLGALGFADGTVIEGSLTSAILNYALLPAVLEEALFRYLPIRLMAHHSPRGTVIISAIFFSLVHMDLFRIPYAFLAGVVFIIIDLMLGSVLPSLIIHFVNNSMSVLFWFYPESAVLNISYITALLSLSALSLLLVYKRRRAYKARLVRASAPGDIGDCYDISALALIIPTLLISVLNLLTK